MTYSKVFERKRQSNKNFIATKTILKKKKNHKKETKITPSKQKLREITSRTVRRKTKRRHSG